MTTLSEVQEVILSCLLGPEDPDGWNSFFRRDENQRYRGSIYREAKKRPEGKKRCCKCRLTKEKRAFYLGRANTDGLNSACKSCSKASAKKNRQENLERYVKQDRERNRTPKHRGEKLLCKYGVSLEDYERILAAQGGVCAICKKKESVRRKENLTVDHNHTTGKVRGLLCHFCNSGLGMFKDSPSLTQAATEYLSGLK